MDDYTVIDTGWASPTPPLSYEEDEEDLLDEASSELPLPVAFNSNLAEGLQEGNLSSLAQKLLDGINEDLESRSDWEEQNKKGIELLGRKVMEEKDLPYLKGTSSVIDSTLSTSLNRFVSVAVSELWPSAGPAKLQILGPEDEMTQQKGQAIIDFINNYLVNVDQGYYPDSNRLVTTLGLYGCAFRKVFLNPNNANAPTSRLVDPQDFIIDNDTRSILESPRITQRLYLTKKEIIQRQRIGLYIDAELKDIGDDDNEDNKIQKTINEQEGIDDDNLKDDNKSLFKFYEVHADLIIDGVDSEFTEDKLPLPYIVTISAQDRKIVSIYRNWKEGDPEFKKINYFVGYTYISDFGIYSVGLARLMGSDALALTILRRIMIDNGKRSIFPGGLIVKGAVRPENNDKAIGPSEYHEVETGGMPIQDSIMNIPVPPPSQVLFELMKDLRETTMQAAAVNEINISDQAPNAPVGSTLALLEINGRMQTQIIRGMRNSLKNELMMIYDLFKHNMEEGAYNFNIPGKSVSLDRSYFADNIQIIPVSDPDMVTATHRILKNEALLKLVNSAPQLHNIREAYHRMYVSMGVKEIDKLLLPPPQPASLDAVTENVFVLQGKPIAVSFPQDDDAHILRHVAFAEENKMNPQIYAPMMEHIQKHKAQKVLKMMMQNMDPMMAQNIMQQPIEQIMQIPDIQNAISKMDADEYAQQMQQMQEQQQAMMAQQKPPIDPNAVMMADIEQKRVASELKAEEVRQKTETEAFKTQMKYDSDIKKIEANQDIAQQKNQVDLAIAEMKMNHDIAKKEEALNTIQSMEKGNE